MAREPREPGVPDDKYARESFTFRRMKSWQLWGVSSFAAVVLVVVLAYSFA
jgi:hypothetical protein